MSEETMRQGKIEFYKASIYALPDVTDKDIVVALESMGKTLAEGRAVKYWVCKDGRPYGVIEEDEEKQYRLEYSGNEEHFPEHIQLMVLKRLYILNRNKERGVN